VKGGRRQNENVTVNPDEVLAPAMPRPRVRTTTRITSANRRRSCGSVRWVKSLLDEARSAPLDEAGRAASARDVYETSIAEPLRRASPDLGTELGKMALPCSAEVPTEVEAANRPKRARRVGEGFSRNSGVTLRPAGRRRGATREDGGDRSSYRGVASRAQGHVPLKRGPSHPFYYCAPCAGTIPRHFRERGHQLMAEDCRPPP